MNMNIALLKDAHDDAFAILGRQGRDAQIDFAAAKFEIDAAVLRHALLGHVQPGDDLDARRQCRPQRNRDQHFLTQDAIDADAHADDAFFLFEMDIRGARLDPQGEDFLDQANHAAGLGVVLFAVAEDALTHDGVDGFLDRSALRVMALDGVDQIRFRRRGDSESQAGGALKRVDGDHVQRIAQDHGQDVAFAAHRQGAVALGEFVGHQCQHGVIDDRGGDIDDFGIGFVGERAGQGLGGDEAECDQTFAEHLALTATFAQREIELRTADDTGGKQTLAERSLAARSRHRSAGCGVDWTVHRAASANLIGRDVHEQYDIGRGCGWRGAGTGLDTTAAEPGLGAGRRAAILVEGVAYAQRLVGG